MAPFSSPQPVVTTLKEKAESLYHHGDRLYVGTATGNLHVYAINSSDTGDSSSEHREDNSGVSLIETKKALVRRSIDQLGFIKQINSLVILSEMVVTLFPLPGFAPPTPLLNAKAAFSFAIHTSVQHVSPDNKGDRGGPSTKFDVTTIPTVVTQLMIGCRRKIVIYTWRDGEAQEVKEAPLPHSPRAIVFMNPDTACFAYAPDYAMFSIPTMSVMEIVTPLPTTGPTTMSGAFSGLTGYMSLGLGAKAKPTVAPVGEEEVLIAKDNEGLFVGKDAKVVFERTNIEWVASPEEIAFINPYVFSVFPAGTVPSQTIEAPSSAGSSQTQLTTIPTSVVQIRSSISSHISQSFSIPFTAADASSTSLIPAPAHNATIKIPLASSSTTSPLYMITTPTDRTSLATEGSSIWKFVMRPWAEQLDELVLEGHYADALKMLDVIQDVALPDKEQRRSKIRALNAVSEFQAAKYDSALETFFKLDMNPAKVIALYPESISGRLAVPKERWIPLFGGPEPILASPSNDEGSSSTGSQNEGGESIKEQEQQEAGDGSEDGDKKPKGIATELLDNLSVAPGPGVSASTTGSIRGRLKGTGLGLLGLHKEKDKDDDTVSVHSGRRVVIHDEFYKSVEKLTGYLVDRRTKLGAVLAAVNITTQNQYDEFKPLSEVSVDDLFALPNAPLSVLTPEQLLRFVQLADTALYKSYIAIRPGLLSSFCRLPNWCEVSEVEEDLRGHKRFSELKDLYYGKKMHSKALTLLRELSEKEEDMEDKLRPSILYLQKLGPEYLDQIFQYSRWIFDQDADMAFEIFLSEDVELPHQAVANYLEGIDPKICAKYLEYVIEERQEETPMFHDRLAELYISMTLTAKRRNEDKRRKEVYTKLLEFLNMNDKIGVDRLYGLLSSTDLYEGRAILLGRLGRHDQALELYVYRLQDYLKAEEYCKRIYQPNTSTASVYITLLRIYLRPTTKPSSTGPGPSDYLQPALDLISRHNPRLDPVETLNLLPPLVTAEDVHAFLIEALRAPIFDTKVLRSVGKARNDQLGRRLMALQSRRVRVTDSRICPQCHKRLGNSVIAVHAPRGEVTHYQCREAFSRKLNQGAR